MLPICLAGCTDDRTPAASYARLPDRIVATLHLEAFATPCGSGKAWIGDAACYRFGPPQRMSGTLEYGFEASWFEPTSHPSDIWLSIDPAAIPAAPKGSTPVRRTFAIDFVGRETLYAGRYGHLGSSRHLVVVDRLISIRPAR